MVYIPTVAVLAHKIIQDSIKRANEPMQEPLPVVENIIFTGFLLEEGRMYLYYPKPDSEPILCKLIQFDYMAAALPCYIELNGEGTAYCEKEQLRDFE